MAVGWVIGKIMSSWLRSWWLIGRKTGSVGIGIVRIYWLIISSRGFRFFVVFDGFLVGHVGVIGVVGIGVGWELIWRHLLNRWHSLRVIGLIIVSIILLLCLFTLSRLLISLLFRLFLQFFSLFLSQFSRLFSLFSGGFLRLFYFFLSLLFLFSFLSTLLPTFATRRSLFFGGRFWFGFDSLLVG